MTVGESISKKRLGPWRTTTTAGERKELEYRQNTTPVQGGGLAKSGNGERNQRKSVLISTPNPGPPGTVR